MPVLDRERRFRYRECDARGKVVISIRWAAGSQLGALQLLGEPHKY
jgi:hypothetical protein